MKIPPEFFIASLILSAILALPLLSYFQGTLLLQGGVFFIALGLGLGVPAGLVYHLLLFRKCKESGINLEGWLIHPQRRQECLDARTQKILSRWFRMGAYFFMVSMGGCGLVFISLFMMR